MEITAKQQERLEDAEACITQYFRAQLRPVMESVEAELSRKRIHEEAEFLSSPAGIMTMSNPYGMGPLQADMAIHALGEWNRKSSEDYLQMCRDGFQSSPYISKDLSRLADLWRKEVIGIIGREAYDEKSRAIGKDLSDAYVSYRMESQMIQHLIDRNPPRSAIEYVLTKGCKESLLGIITNAGRSSPLDSEIADAAERAYAPTVFEKGAGKALSFGVDLLTTGGISSWASVGRLAVAEIAIEGGTAIHDYLTSEQSPATVEQYISEGVLGCDRDFLSRCQAESLKGTPDLNDRVRAFDEDLEGRMKLLDKELATRLFSPVDYSLGFNKREDAATDDVQIPYARGHEENQPKAMDTESNKQIAYMASNTENATDAGTVILEEEQQACPPEQGTSGWGEMLSATGLDGLEGVGRNLGYVVSMLPDVLVGLFNGKTRNLGIKDNMLPIASILVGLFVKNPLLKTVLIGMGGLNLFNKAGKEAIEDQRARDSGVSMPRQRFKQYCEEPLNPRMGSPEIKGHSLFASIDGVPCTIQLPESTLAAYHAGALPLSTLANAVLAKSDEMARLAQERYEEQEGRSATRGQTI